MEGTFKIITLGCKVNQFESAALGSALLDLGLREAPRKEKADITIVNTCIVTQKASQQSRQAIRGAIRENPTGMTAAVGCYAQVYPGELAGIPGLDLIAGNTVKARLPEILAGWKRANGTVKLVEAFSDHSELECLPVKGFLNRTRAFLKIQDGCHASCSYCIVPLARGPLRSLKPSLVLAMLEEMSRHGFKEIVLTGIHLGKYGADLGDHATLPALLREIGKTRPAFRVRLSSIEPNEIGDELIDLVASEKWLCRHFHVPLQSGDNRILERMKRPYLVEEFMGLIDRIKAEVPLSAVGVDVMAGFPGEDERAHLNTLAVIEDLPVSYLHVFPFSPREGTEAAGFKGRVDQALLRKRTEQIRRLGLAKRQAFYRSCIGKDFVILSEGWNQGQRGMARGLSDNYLPVLFPSEKPLDNKFVLLRIERMVDQALMGTSSGPASP
ncbi:MAG: tRNA (N(6)-L-threonylcarbamoyladenosine(37)-C(2))-methylthiotransferase MtaB [Deltaproteobacteria bacterium]|nr:tRNA (N(6)-L-threonylcarbamoyladenosine(37)-C(2))-methylthiotransferase MtaB [Deltaproteobacteria bacterium]